jgi:soluble lytic murein transglycosylase-like protein
MFSATSQSRIITVVVALLFPALLPGQDAMVTQNSRAAIDRQFAAVDASLVETAEELLINSHLAEVIDTKGHDAKDREATNASPAQEEISARRNSSPAFSRLESLRPQIEPILQMQGLPVELSAIVLIESGANAAALSPKGARGLWQLMPETARRYGLTVNASHDERLDIEKSTRAASRYLSDLRVQFGSWPLALAAYNTGEQNLQRAICRAHSTEFPILSSMGLLPLETRNYVPAVMGAMHSMGKMPDPSSRAPSPRGIIAFALTTQE